MPERFVLRLEPSGGAEPSEEFRAMFDHVGSFLAALAEYLDVPDLEVAAVIAADFRAAVQEAWSAMETATEDSGAPFNPQRLTGEVGAKTIPMVADHSRARVVFDDSLLGSGRPLNSHPAPLLAVQLVAHELSHALISRLRWASGVSRDEPIPPTTPSELARSMTRIAVDELRCDMIADFALAAVGTVSEQGQEPRPAHLADALPVGHRSDLGTWLDTHVYPAWPDNVEAVPGGRGRPDQMWFAVVDGTSQALVKLGHAEAECASLGVPNPIVDEFADHPAVRLYLGPVWEAIMGEVAKGPLPTLATFRQLEDPLVSEGEKAILAMWGRLGLTFYVSADGMTSFDIGRPQR